MEFRTELIFLSALFLIASAAVNLAIPVGSFFPNLMGTEHDATPNHATPNHDEAIATVAADEAVNEGVAIVSPSSNPLIFHDQPVRWEAFYLIRDLQGVPALLLQVGTPKNGCQNCPLATVVWQVFTSATSGCAATAPRDCRDIGCGPWCPARATTA